MDDVRAPWLMLAVLVAVTLAVLHRSEPEPKRVVGFHVPYVPPMCRAILKARPRLGYTRWTLYAGSPLVRFECGYEDGPGAATWQPIAWDYSPVAVDLSSRRSP